MTPVQRAEKLFEAEVAPKVLWEQLQCSNASTKIVTLDHLNFLLES